MSPARQLALAAAMLLGGCVTERPKPGLHFQGRPVGGGAAGSQRSAATLPEGPVAAPILNSSFNSSVQVEVVPIGGISYDGQVLPLVSPDGRFLASEEGRAPTWPTLLAAPGAAVPLSTRIAVYDISQNPVRVVSFPQPLPRGLVLGRGADDDGFLVEAPQPDGSRWIGRVQWASGTLRWLVRDGQVNAHPVLTPAGSLAYIARGISSDEGTLVLRAVDGTETTRAGDGSSHLYPVASPEPGIICTLSRTTAGLQLLAWSLDTGDEPDADRSERLGSIVSRALVSPGGDAALAYQITAPSPVVLPRRVSEPWLGERPVVFHPQFGCMAEFDRAAGGLVLLPPHSIAGARAGGAGAGGWFVTTPDGLVYSPDASRADSGPGQRRTVPSVRVLAGPYVPRQTSNPERPLVLLGPARDPNRLQVLVLRFVSPAPDSDAVR